MGLEEVREEERLREERARREQAEARAEAGRRRAEAARERAYPSPPATTGRDPYEVADRLERAVDAVVPRDEYERDYDRGPRKPEITGVPPPPAP